MSVKWKIFFALNFVLSLPALVCFILLLINFLNSFRLGGDFVFIIGFLLITLNGFLNIFLLQRYYPDKLIPAAVKTLSLLSLIFNILASIGLLIVCIYGASEEFRGDYEGKDERGKIALAVIFFLWLVQVAVLVMQAQLPGLISRNNRENMHSLIDSIGR